MGGFSNVMIKRIPYVSPSSSLSLVKTYSDEAKRMYQNGDTELMYGCVVIDVADAENTYEESSELDLDESIVNILYEDILVYEGYKYTNGSYPEDEFMCIKTGKCYDLMNTEYFTRIIPEIVELKEPDGNPFEDMDLDDLFH